MNEELLDQKYPVCIVRVGARTPLGLNSQASAAAVRAAIGAIRQHPYFVDKTGEPMMVTMDSALSPDLEGVDRFYELALPAMNEALAPAVELKGIRLPIPTFIGLPEKRPGRPNDLEAELSRRLESKFPVQIRMIPNGHTSGLMALEEARRAIQDGEAEFCLAGGVDSYLEPETLEWLDAEKQLLSAENRSGLVPGEAASFILVTSTSIARRFHLSISAWIIGTATVLEEHKIKTDSVCIGAGLSDAIFRATQSLELPAEKVSAMICDLNGERYRSEEFTFAVLRTQAVFDDANDFLTPADCCGDVGAASGMLFANLAIESGQRGYSKGTRILLWTSSEGGERGATVLQISNATEGR
jgi:3-oxoacyl-[acyl-carrier-protein] synthase-1